MTAATDRLQTAVRLHQSGRWDEAEPIYRDLLRTQPGRPEVLYLLGTMQYQRGAFGSARMFLRKAVASNPRLAEAHNNLGLAHQELGEWEAAAAAFERAAALAPDYAEARYNLGNLYRERGDFERAAACYRAAVERDDRFAEAHDNLGVALRELGRLEEAVQAHARAVELKPNLAGARNNLGAALKGLGDHRGAEAAFRAALAIDPSLAAARSNLGITLAHMRRFDEAESECRLALQDDPSSATARNNLGLVLFLNGDEGRAAVEFDEACRLRPGFGDALNNLGSALFRAKRCPEAIDAYRRSLEVRPTVVAYKNLGSVLEHCCDWAGAAESFRAASALRGGDVLLDLRAAGVCPSIWGSADEIDQYRAGLEAALDRCIEARIRRPIAELVDFDLRPSFHLQFHGRDDRALREKYARAFQRCAPRESPPPRRSGAPKVGFVVSAGHEYAFCRSIGGFFRLFRRDLWRPVVVCDARGVERIRASLGDPDVEILPLPSDWDGLVEAVRLAAFDMLYHWEIATGAANYFLPMLRLAPLQCTSWGIQVTSGLPAVDYYLSSSLIESDDADRCYSERLVRLETLLSYQRRMEIPEKPLSRAALGLPEGANLYLCPQQLGKFHPEFDAALAEILRRDPVGRVAAPRSSFEAETRALQERFQRTMPDVADRILWIDKRRGAEYASLILAADVLLDPTPFGGVNTTYDGFSAGKAIVTLPGPLQRGRYTLGCYRRMGLAAPVAASLEEYAAVAVRLASDLDFRRSVEAEIAASSEVLFEQRSAAVELEEWMLETIEQHRDDGNRPTKSPGQFRLSGTKSAEVYGLDSI